MKYTQTQKYTVTNTYLTEVEPLSKFTKTDFFEPKDLFVVEVTNNEVQEGFSNKRSQNKTQKIINEVQLAEVLKNPQLLKEQSTNIESPIVAAKQGFQAYVTHLGFSSDLHTFMNLSKKTQNDFFVKDIIKNKEEINIFQFIKNEQHLRLWKNSENTLFMEPFIFDYIGAQIDNKKYDLDKLVEHLMLRDDVAFTSVNSNNKTLLVSPLSGNEKGVQNIISDIPYYNQEEGRDETICLVYYPKPEHISKILTFNPDKQYYNIDTFIMGEILQANTCLKTPIHQEEPPKRKFKKN